MNETEATTRVVIGSTPEEQRGIPRILQALCCSAFSVISLQMKKCPSSAVQRVPLLCASRIHLALLTATESGGIPTTAAACGYEITARSETTARLVFLQGAGRAGPLYLCGIYSSVQGGVSARVTVRRDGTARTPPGPSLRLNPQHLWSQNNMAVDCRL